MLLETLQRIDFAKSPRDVIVELQRVLREYLSSIPARVQFPDAGILLVGGGGGTTTVGRSLLTSGILRFSTMPNVFDRELYPKTFELRGSGLVRTLLDSPDVLDTFTHLFLIRPQAWSNPLTRFLAEHVRDIRRGYFVLAVAANLLGFQEAVDWLTGEMENSWRVVPTTVIPTEIQFTQDDVVMGLYDYILRRPDPSRVFDRMLLDPPARLSSDADQAIAAARHIVIGPGDVHFTVLPHWLVAGFKEALETNEAAALVLVANLTARDVDIPGFTLSMFLDLWDRYLPADRQVTVLVNSETFDGALRDDIAADRHGQRFALIRKPIASAQLSRAGQPIHDVERLGEALKAILSRT